MAPFSDHYGLVESCPPPEAAPTELVVYRVVGRSATSRAQDYVSHYDRDSERFPTCEHRSLSVWISPEEAAQAWQLVNQRISSSRRVAKGKIQPADGVVLHTPFEVSADVVLDGHYDWWVALGVETHRNFTVGKKMGEHL